MGFQFGDLILARYNYWQHDQLPFVFIFYDSGKLIDGLNGHYLSRVEVQQIRQLLKSVMPGQERLVYPFLKARFNSVLRAYRRYHVHGFFPIKRWKVKELASPRTRQKQDKEIKQNLQYNKKPAFDALMLALLNQLKDTLTRLENK